MLEQLWVDHKSAKIVIARALCCDGKLCSSCLKTKVFRVDNQCLACCKLRKDIVPDMEAIQLTKLLARAQVKH
jgi:hypothetical protein